MRFIALGTKTWFGPSVDFAYFITPCQTTLNNYSHSASQNSVLDRKR